MDAAKEKETLDREVRRHVYDFTINEGRPPTVAETARALSVASGDARDSIRRLADAFVLVLQNGGDEILMAAPFSAVPTPFVVRSGGQSYFANCAWDALGIPALLKQDAEVEASCGCCGTAMSLRVTSSALEEADGLIHFALPASRWWENIAFT